MPGRAGRGVRAPPPRRRACRPAPLTSTAQREPKQSNSSIASPVRPHGGTARWSRRTPLAGSLELRRLRRGLGLEASSAESRIPAPCASWIRRRPRFIGGAGFPSGGGSPAACDASGPDGRCARPAGRGPLSRGRRSSAGRARRRGWIVDDAREQRASEPGARARMRRERRRIACRAQLGSARASKRCSAVPGFGSPRAPPSWRSGRAAGRARRVHRRSRRCRARGVRGGVARPAPRQPSARASSSAARARRRSRDHRQEPGLPGVGALAERVREPQEPGEGGEAVQRRQRRTPMRARA